MFDISIATLTEEAWNEQKDQLKQRLRTIVIPLDISAGVAKGLLSRIDGFFSEVRIDVAELESEKESVDSIIREWERSKATGTNDMVRKKNATEAIQNYPIGGEETMNLYEAQRTINKRYAFLQGILDTLNGKQSRLITISGVLKLEKDLAPYADMGPGWGAGQ